MSISTVPSSTKRASYARRKKAVTHKRLQNQNAEISELASLFPVSMLPLPSIEGNQSEAAGPLVPSNGYSSPAMDKLSVLRLASSYLKLQQFMKDTTHVNGSYESTKHPFGVIEKAIDGFLLVLDKEGNILYVSETITDCVGLRQQDVIGQSLVDITHPSSAVEIMDGLKPSLTFPSSVAQPDRVFSQLRQFYVRFKSTVYNSRITSHTMVQVNGNLKVKLPPSKTPPSHHGGQLEFVEPSVVGFIGECHRIDSGCSTMDVVLPLTSFSWTKTLDRKLISCDATVKDIIGYSADELIASNGTIELLHPAYSNIREPMKNYFLRNGHMVSPLVRVLTSSGDWIWMTTEVTLRCKSGTTIPQFVDFKARVFSQGIGKVKYALDRKTHISISTLSPALAVADGDSAHCSTTSKKSKETTKSSTEEVLKGIKLPDAIFKAVLQSRARERATLVADVDNTAACCESTTESNSSCSDISSKVSQLGVLDPEHQLLPPQLQVDQPTCTAASAMTQAKNEGGATCSSDPPPVSSIAAYGDSDTSRASPLSDSHKVVCSSTAQPGHGACTSPPVCISHDHTPTQSPDTVDYCADVLTSHADKDSSYSPAHSHSTSKSLEQAALSPVEDPTSSPGSGGTGSSPNNVSHNDFQVQTNTNSQSTDCGLFTGGTHSPINSSSTSMCGGVNLSSCANLQAVETSLHAVAALDPLQQDHQTSNILSQGFSDLDFNFGCTIPCDAAPTASNPEYTPNYLMPGAQSLMFNDLSDHSDSIMQQVLGDTDIMGGNLNLGLYANDTIISDCARDWSKSMESATPYCSLSPQCHTNFTAYSVTESGDRCSWYQRRTSHSDSISDFNEVNHEVHDILQQFM